MSMPIGKVTLTVQGEHYEATIDRIRARAADPDWPWDRDKGDVLIVWLDFGKQRYPAATLGFGVEVPAKEYVPEELLSIIQVEGQRRRGDAKDARQKELDNLASQLTDALRSSQKGG